MPEELMTVRAWPSVTHNTRPVLWQGMAQVATFGRTVFLTICDEIVTTQLLVFPHSRCIRTQILGENVPRFSASNNTIRVLVVFRLYDYGGGAYSSHPHGGPSQQFRGVIPVLAKGKNVY